MVCFLQFLQQHITLFKTLLYLLLYDSYIKFYSKYINSKTQYHLNSSSNGKMAQPLPANVGWSINSGRVSSVSQHQLEYELPKILGISQSINYISHWLPHMAPTTFWQHFTWMVKKQEKSVELNSHITTLRNTTWTMTLSSKVIVW